MVNVGEATEVIQSVRIELPVVETDISAATGKVLREVIKADRDLPPFDRVMMDGIAIRYQSWEQGCTSFPIEGMQKAGLPQQKLSQDNHCLEVMTGAVLPGNTDTVIQYEDIEIHEKDGETIAFVKTGPKARRQHIHARGTNRKKQEVLVEEGTILGPSEIAVAAIAGKSVLKVTQSPRVVVISTGDELVDIDQTPLPHQIRRSNVYALSAALKGLDIEAEILHLRDDKEEIFSELGYILDRCKILILSGGVSKGKLDYIPEMLESRGIEKLFHGVRQRPGKPFWFGRSENIVVFALPGNPVSSFICYYRYIAPWLKRQLGIRDHRLLSAQLAGDYFFDRKLTCFLQVGIQVNANGILEAKPITGKGSSDLANLCQGDGFLELPESRDRFITGESYPLYLYRAL